MSRTKKRNPGMRGNASGATKANLTEAHDTAPAPALQSGGADAFTRDRLKWLEAVTDAPALPKGAHRVAAKLALRFLSRERGIAWPSVATLAECLQADRKAILAAIAALETAGFLAVTRSKGRGHANEYALTIPARKGGEIDTFSHDRKGGEKATFSDPLKGGVSHPEKVVNLPPHPFEEPSEGAGARSRARPAPSLAGEVGSFSEPETDAASYDGRAPEGAPVKAPAGDLSPEHAAVKETRAAASEIEGAPDPFDFSDLPDLVGDAAADLRALHGEAVGDAEALANDLADGFTNDDPDAASRAARRVAKLLLDAGSDARETWAAHRRIAGRLIDAFAMGAARAEAAKRAFDDAVGIAGKAILARRRETETADQGAAHG